MNDGTLHHPLEAGSGFGIGCHRRPQAVQFVVDEIGQLLLQLGEVDAAGLQNRRRILVLGQRQEQMFEGRILVPALGGQCQSAMQGLF